MMSSLSGGAFFEAGGTMGLTEDLRHCILRVMGASMKAKVLVVSTVAVVVMSLMAPIAASAQGDDYDRPVTQQEFATGVVGAILGQVRTSIDPVEAMNVMKNRGLVPASWTGEGNVTMEEAARTFHLLGFQIYVEDSEFLLSSGVFEQILRSHMGEIKRTKHHWAIVHHFSMGLELGEYRERIISPSGF